MYYRSSNQIERFRHERSPHYHYIFMTICFGNNPVVILMECSLVGNFLFVISWAGLPMVPFLHLAFWNWKERKDHSVCCRREDHSLGSLAETQSYRKNKHFQIPGCNTELQEHQPLWVVLGIWYSSTAFFCKDTNPDYDWDHRACAGKQRNCFGQTIHSSLYGTFLLTDRKPADGLLKHWADRRKIITCRNRKSEGRKAPEQITLFETWYQENGTDGWQELPYTSGQTDLKWLYAVESEDSFLKENTPANWWRSFSRTRQSCFIARAVQPWDLLLIRKEITANLTQTLVSEQIHRSFC